MELPTLDTEYLLDVLVRLLNTPSPTGLAEPAVALVEKELASLRSLTLRRTRKGALVASWKGAKGGAATAKLPATPRALTAHVDTLGAMVKEVKPNGRLKLTKIGGFAWNTVEGEGCWVLTSGGKRVRGSFLLEKASSHVHGAAVSKTEREDDTMEVRLDALTDSPEQTRALGVEVGDFVVFDPRVEQTEGFIRSRHLDDKACVACLLAAVRAMHQAGLDPAQDTYLHISNYEEVGHGAAAGIPPQVQELVTVDMAAVGEGQASDEFHATLCAKDTGGPYHPELNAKLLALAREHNIPFKVDVYPHYGSDGEAFWRAGGDLQISLIGPGVDASHSYERTHTKALEATANWIMAYLLS
jgi:putative aminopeptidase FrvX